MNGHQELAGRVAVVTGAGRNIGRAIALALADGGAAVVVNGRSNKAQVDDVVREIEAGGGRAFGTWRMWPMRMAFTPWPKPPRHTSGVSII